MKCLATTCQRPGTPVGRGLCLLCYSRAKFAVKAGTTTWQELEAIGLVNPSAEDDPFTKALNEAKARGDVNASDQ